jgi:hypothetical protein
MPSRSSETTEGARGSASARLISTTGVPRARQRVTTGSSRPAAVASSSPSTRREAIPSASAAARARVVARVRDQQGVAARRQHGFRARQDRREDRVGDARHEGADQARAAGAQRRGRGVRPVAEPGGLGQHAGGHGLGDQVPRVRVDGAGHGRDVDAGGLGDALEGRGSAPGRSERRSGAAA